MSVSRFRFVSPGVFINEVDQSELPATPAPRGPVIIGRSEKGPGFRPIQVRNYEEFVEIFGNPIPGGRGGDVWRDGNYSSPTYAAYAAQAYLRNNSPLTFVRVLGSQKDSSAASKTHGASGWATDAFNGVTGAGAWGLFLIASSSATTKESEGTPSSFPLVSPISGTLAAIFYCNSGSYLAPSGTVRGITTNGEAAALGTLIDTRGSAGSSGPRCVMSVQTGSGTDIDKKTVVFDFDPNSDLYIRKVFNTNPQKVNTNITDNTTTFWLGESYERAVSDVIGTSDAHMIMLALKAGDSGPDGGDYLALNSGDTPVAAQTGYFISQDQNDVDSSFNPETGTSELFKIVALNTSGEWEQRNLKISVRDIRMPSAQEEAAGDAYPTFGLEVRKISDTDVKPVVLESYSSLNLNPNSANFIARRIGDKVVTYNTTTRRFEESGDYNNVSKLIRVVLSDDVKQGLADPILVPAGVKGPIRYVGFAISGSATGAGCNATIKDLNGIKSGNMNLDETNIIAGGFPTSIGSFHHTTASLTLTAGAADDTLYTGLSSAGLCIIPYLSGAVAAGTGDQLHIFMGSGSAGEETGEDYHAEVTFPAIPLIRTSSQMGFTDPRKAYFGVDLGQSTTATTRFERSTWDVIRPRASGYSSFAKTAGTTAVYAGVTEHMWTFTLDDVQKSGSVWIYAANSRAQSSSFTAASGSIRDLVNTQKISKFTTVMHGGFDGLDITEKDPFRNTYLDDTAGPAGGTTEETNYAVHSIQKAMDSIKDPEEVEYNLASMPGITVPTLTDDLIDVCEDRGDALAVIDIQHDYRALHEGTVAGGYPILPSVKEAVNTMKTRSTNSSYGAAFFPFVQIRDQRTNQLVWAPPSVAALGVMGSSAAKSEVWFAPAGFNRGGLSKGAAGIPVVNVRSRLTARDRDDLYDVRVNPIASFPSEGIVIFGQKTLQLKKSALDRINVRRLLIFLKKEVSFFANQVLFDPNVQVTWNRFLGLVDPFLRDVKTRFGLTDYKIVLDETTTTPDLIDRNILYAKIFLKPARAIEFIALDFIITRSGAAFED